MKKLILTMMLVSYSSQSNAQTPDACESFNNQLIAACTLYIQPIDCKDGVPETCFSKELEALKLYSSNLASITNQAKSIKNCSLNEASSSPQCRQANGYGEVDGGSLSSPQNN